MEEFLGNDSELRLEEDTQHGKYLTFSLGAETFALEIKYATEIIRIQTIAHIPEMPGFIKGIINLRGKIIPVIDVRMRFKIEPQHYTDRTCIIIVTVIEHTIGFIVDRVLEVIYISEEEIVPPPLELTSYHARYIKAIGKVGQDVKLILDCEKVLKETKADLEGRSLV